MKIISHQQIKSLGILPSICVEWVKESFSLKKDSEMPAKISVHPHGYDFFTAMPCLLPSSYDRVALKMVHRVKGSVPVLGSDLLLYQASTGRTLAMMDADWITAMRTGATATVAAQTLRRTGDVTYCLVGLGNMAAATILCLLSSEPQIMHRVLLKRYKDQAERFILRFSSYENVTFEVVDDIYEMFSSSDVIISCITDADGLFCEDPDCFRPGCTLIPVHARGFQNCDLFFDKVIGDDTAQIQNWQNFTSYKYFAELSQVLDGTAEGRASDSERIISYNYGLGLHDALFASKIYDMLAESAPDIEMEHESVKFWV